MKRQIVTIKSDIVEIMFRFQDVETGDINHTVLIENAQGLKFGSVKAATFAGDITADQLKLMRTLEDATDERG